jgi:hypothetical protein
MQSGANESESSVDGMACDFGKRTNPLETIRNRPTRANG